MAKVKLLDPSDPRRRLDRYELIGEIATGGMATVFLARLGGVGGFQRFVAIKRLHPHLANEQEFVEMFLDEARLAALIHHPHVVPILEVGVSDSGYYIVMEYVEGDTLSKIVARSMSGGRMVPRHILVRILLDMLSGLHAAHELADDRGQLLGLVHRDVSPQNVLVGVDGSSRITDFGVARATARLTSTGSGKLKGKLAYMAPEQTRGDELDRRTDLFAAGIISWEVLAGKRLFKAETEAATLNRILVGPVRPASDINPEIPRIFDTVLAKALDRDPSRRFQTAQEMFDAIELTAIESAKTASAEVGIASPREVAAYVQSVLGQEIGAQRESVRAWLAQSDSSAPRVSASSMPPRDVPRARESVPHRRGRRDADDADYQSASYDGPPPIAPMADVTMRFALQNAPARPMPPAKRSSPTLIGQGPIAPPPERVVPPPAAGSPAPAASEPVVSSGPPRFEQTEQQRFEGLATSLLGEEGDDAPTVLKQSSRPPSAIEEADASRAGTPPQAYGANGDGRSSAGAEAHHGSSEPPQGGQFVPSVKTARGLFAADLLERARIEAEKATLARAAAHHANGASGEGDAHTNGAHFGDPGAVTSRTGSAPDHDPGYAGARAEPRGDAAGTSLTNGSMTLPSHYQQPYPYGAISEPEPPKRGVLRYVVLGVVGLSLAAAIVIFLQMRGSSNGDATAAPTPTASATTTQSVAPQPTTAVTAPTSEPTSSASSAASAKAPSGKPGSAKTDQVKGGTHPKPVDHPTPPSHPDPAPPSTPTPPPVPTPQTPPPSSGAGDDLSNPYHPK